MLNDFPYLKYLIKKVIRILKGNTDTSYPETSGNEIKQVKNVLYSHAWNLSYSSEGKHTELEKKFSEYIGTEYAVAVNTGGMALQMICRGLGMKHGDEAIHQADTCVATSFALMNAGVTPILTDINTHNFLLNEADVVKNIGSHTKAIMPIHMWGNAENMDFITATAKKYNLYVIEDSCLALGATYNGKKTGSFGTAAAFSFGCLKPVQAGEGGMITTNDKALYNELLMLRNWGETTGVLGYRDNQQLAWNGRVSEFVAAVALEQLKAYPEHLKQIKENAALFERFLEKIQGVEMVHGTGNATSSYAQVVLKLNSSELKISKSEMMQLFLDNHISCWHANFEPINSLSFFKNDKWNEWILKGDLEKVKSNYHGAFINTNKVYHETGLGISKQHFLNRQKTKALMNTIEKLLVRK